MRGKTARILRGMARATWRPGMKWSYRTIYKALKRSYKAGRKQWRGAQRHVDIDLNRGRG